MSDLADQLQDDQSGGITYAITHASTALALKRKFPRVGLWPLLISVQLVELLWILFTYLGIEHSQITPDAIHLDYLPYSHSVGTGLLLAALAWGLGKTARRSRTCKDIRFLIFWSSSPSALHAGRFFAGGGRC